MEIAFTGCLGLDVADDVLLAVPNPKIWIAGFGLLGKRRYVDVRLIACLRVRRDHFFEGGVEALLPGIALRHDLMNILEVAAE